MGGNSPWKWRRVVGRQDHKSTYVMPLQPPRYIRKNSLPRCYGGNLPTIFEKHIHGRSILPMKHRLDGNRYYETPIMKFQSETQPLSTTTRLNDHLSAPSARHKRYKVSTAAITRAIRHMRHFLAPSSKFSNDFGFLSAHAGHTHYHERLKIYF